MGSRQRRYNRERRLKSRRSRVFLSENTQLDVLFWIMGGLLLVLMGML